MDPDMRHRLRQAREQAGWSFRRLAGSTHYSHSFLAHVESGRRPVTRAVAAGYERALGVTLTDGAFWPDDPIRAAHQWLLDGPHPVTAHRGAGRRVGDDFVGELERRVAALRHADDTTPAADLYPTVAAELDSAMCAARDCAAGAHQNRLWTVAAETAQLAGWLAADLGKDRRATDHYLTGARMAADKATAAQNWSCLAYHRANTGRADDGLLLARTAVAGVAGSTTPLVETLLQERVAWSAAQAGAAEHCRHALMAAENTFAAAAGGAQAADEPEWVYWLDRREVDIMAARCRLVLGDAGGAIPLLETALATYPHEHAREASLYHSYAAEAYHAIGDTTGAQRHVDALMTAAEGASSARVDARLAVVAE